MKIAAIVQARMTSTRLPNKVLMKLAGKENIYHVFNQLYYSKIINEIILATSTDKSDDELEKWGNENGKKVFRGDLDDVLKRFYDAAVITEADIIVRITGDCPLIDPEVVDKVIEMFLKDEYDYCSNTNPPTFPDGLDTEVFTFASLEKAYKEAKLKSELEHVTPYIRNNTEIFKLGNYSSEINYEHYRWTLDNLKDYEFLKIIFENLYEEKSYIKHLDVIKYIENNKDIIEINSKIQRNEGYTKSLKEDAKEK